jgi:hypothetical protein
MVPETGRMITEKLECLKAAVTYTAERRFDIIRLHSFSFQIADPDDDVGNDAIAKAVYLEAGIRTEWSPQRPRGTAKQATTKLEVTTEVPVTTKLPVTS